MSAYESLAACYDELTYDIRYEKTLTFFERLCAREHVQPHSVLDLACGTGSLSLLLAGRGYRVIGADLSEDMLAEAERKAQALPEESRPFLICQPMQRLRLAEPVDAVVCALDSLNYLTKPADCRKTFRRVIQRIEARRAVRVRHQYAREAAWAGRTGISGRDGRRILRLADGV